MNKKIDETSDAQRLVLTSHYKNIAQVIYVSLNGCLPSSIYCGGASGTNFPEFYHSCKNINKLYASYSSWMGNSSVDKFKLETDLFIYSLKSGIVVSLERECITIYHNDTQKDEAVAYYNEAISWIKEHTVTIKTQQIHVMVSNSKNELLLRSVDLLNSNFDFDISDNYNDNIIETTIALTVELNTKNKGCYIFHGPPGTGKTSYIKWISTQVEKKFIFIPSGYSHILSSPDFIYFIENYKNSVLIIEDAENVVQSRESHQVNKDAVSGLLNLTDGIMSDYLNLQIILSFNTELTNVDKALMRKGRLNQILKFDELTVDKVAKLLDKKSITLPNDIVEMTLANVYNYTDEENTYNKDKKKVGFQKR